MSAPSFQPTPVLIDKLQGGAVSARNRLLATLSHADFSLLEPQLEAVSLPVGTRLVERYTPIGHVYFLEQGIASVVAATPQGRRIEVGIIGPDGLTGTSILLGADCSPHECFIQMPGSALRIRATIFAGR
jgi:CRP-like cAMP-binding protein